MTIAELEEVVSITADQKSWQNPSFKFDASRLAKLCGNLVTYDEANKSISLAHHTVEVFLLSSLEGQKVASFAIDERETEQFLADICLTYLSFTDFHNAVTRTSNTEYLRAMDHPVRIVGSLTPKLIRPWASNALRSRRGKKADQPIDLVNVLRTELSTYQSKKIDPSFQILDYCKSYWHNHVRHMDLQDTKRLTALENFVRGTHLPEEWMPWSSIKDDKSLPFWEMFVWAVRNGHRVIFCVWQRIATMPESSYWSRLWLEEGQVLFGSACAKSNLEQLEIILEAKRRDSRVVTLSESDIINALVMACHVGNDAVIERLLQEKADVNAVAEKVAEDYDGRTALQAAAKGGYLAVVERLLQENADVNAPAAKFGSTALQYAAMGGHLAVVERLLQGNADVNAAESGSTALQQAAKGGHLAVVEKLLQENADVNARADGGGPTALQYAARGGHLAVVEKLLQENADVNAPAAEGRSTALQYAAEGGHLAVVERLLQENVNVNAAAARGGSTALQVAAAGGHLAVVERLLQENANVNTPAARGGSTALQAAAAGGHLAVVECLQNAGAVK